MGLHDPFGYLKHRLWPKEGWESNCQFDSQSLKVGNHFDLLACKWLAIYRWKALDEGYNFFSNLISIGGLHKTLWASKVMGVSISEQNDIWMQAHDQAQKILWGGRWWLPLSPGCDESRESMFARGGSMHQKCSNYTLTNLLFGLCKSVWITDPLVTHPNPHPEAPVRPFTPKMLWTREHNPIHYPSIVFHIWIRSWVY
jgi:hypothetical protein